MEKYIATAIESVLNQSLDPLLYEVVVVDDCSTDKSPEIIKTYGRVRYFRSDENIGVLGATLIGLEESKGDLIFFLDGDDVWDSSKLSLVVQYFINNSRLVFMTHDLGFINSAGHQIERKSRSEIVMNKISLDYRSDAIRDGILFQFDYVWLGSAYAINRKLGKVKEFCDFARSLPDLNNTYQDWPLAYWIATQKNVAFGYVNNKLLNYRLHGLNHSGDASSSSKALRNFCRTRNTIKAIKQIALQNGVTSQGFIVIDRKLAYSEYLVSLYDGKKWYATKGFFLAFPYFLTGPISFWKEILRFFALQLLGVKYFIRIAASRNSI